MSSLAGICWKSFEAKNINHTNNLIDMKFKALRIFLNLADYPQETPTQSYIEKIMNLQDGMWAWDNYSKNFWSSANNEKVKDAFIFCKNNGWLPICCFGHSEEQSSWLTRCPSQDKWEWLRLFATQFARYLKNMGFKRSDIEVWNEPNECLPPDQYCSIAINMAMGWKAISADNKVHVFASNIREQSYLDNMLANKGLMQYADYISPHILSHDEWDSNLIDITYNKALVKGKKLSLLEISPLGNMQRLNKIIGKCDMYGLVLIIRNSLVGTAMDIDDFLVYDFDNPDIFVAVSRNKMDFVADFNNKYFNGILEPVQPANLPALGDFNLTKNFKYSEFWCQGKEPPLQYKESISKLATELQKVRDIIGRPIKITSGFRTSSYNNYLISIGYPASKNSLHLQGLACDSRALNMSIQDYGLYLARYTGFKGIGIMTTAVHTDLRNDFTLIHY